jgi:hypothetical protein
MVSAPRIVALLRNGQPVTLPSSRLRRVVEDLSGIEFWYSSDGTWVFSMQTRDLAQGGYLMRIETPDGRRLDAAFTIR